MNTQDADAGHAITREEADEQMLMPYDQNLARLRDEEAKKASHFPPLSEAPMDENLVDDDIIEDGGHTT